MVAAVSAITSADTAAIIGSMDSVAYTYMRTGWVCVAGGWLLAFINSFDEVTLSIFVSSPATQTLPVRMYVYATESIDPMMAAVSALVIALTAATMILLDRVYGLDRVLVGKH